MKSRDSPERELNVLTGIVEQELRRLYDGTIPWRTWLDRAARFGSYGFANTLLIAAQSRLATEVDTFDGWKARGRHVRKGEHGIRIIVDEGPRSVFDIAQTAGPEPARRRRLTAGQADRLLQATGVSHGVRRVEAESVSYLVRARFGAPDGTSTFEPVLEWAGPDPYPAITALGDRVLRTAERIERLAEEYWVMHAAAQEFFEGHCADSWVPGYLAARSLPDPARCEIGHAPKSWRALTDHLESLGHAPDQIVRSGLARRGRDGTVHDTFHDRAMIPLRDPYGAVIAFIGRRPDSGPGPKYLNSPDSPIFTKGEVLYTPPRSGPLARPLLVEGPFDALAVAVAAPTDWTPYAPCGTALTKPQAHLLTAVAQPVSPHAAATTRGASMAEGAPVSRETAAGLSSPDLRAASEGGAVVAFDGDRAGREAAVRAWGVLGELLGPVEAAVLPAGCDPADLLRDRGPAALREALRARVPLEDLVVDAKLARTGPALEHRVAAAQAAAVLIAELPARQAARQVARVADRLDLPADLVTEALLAAISPPVP